MTPTAGIAGGFFLFCLRAGDFRFGFSKLRPGVEQGDFIRRVIDSEQHVSRFNQLVVAHVELQDAAGNLGRDANLLGADLAVAGPRGLRVVIPDQPGGNNSQRGDQQRG